MLEHATRFSLEGLIKPRTGSPFSKTQADGLERFLTLPKEGPRPPSWSIVSLAVRAGGWGWVDRGNASAVNEQTLIFSRTKTRPAATYLPTAAKQPFYRGGCSGERRGTKKRDDTKRGTRLHDCHNYCAPLDVAGNGGTLLHPPVGTFFCVALTSNSPAFINFAYVQLTSTHPRARGNFWSTSASTTDCRMILDLIKKPSWCLLGRLEFMLVFFGGSLCNFDRPLNFESKILPF